MAKPTHQDAELMLQLLQWRLNPSVHAAFRWLRGKESIADDLVPGSDEDSYALLICGNYENIGTLWKHGLINEDLLFDWLGITPFWDKMKGFALGQRQRHSAPELWENFEAMALAQRAWKERKAAARA